MPEWSWRPLAEALHIGLPSSHQGRVRLVAARELLAEEKPPPKKYDHRPLAQAMGWGRPPLHLAREGRVELIAEAARGLIETGTKAGLFTGGGLLAWLENGGDLARDYFQVVKPKSHRTPAAIWRELQAHPDEGEEDEHAEE